MLFRTRSKFPFTGGRNGYGAKLCNIFSKKFIVETSAKDFKKGFRQVSKVVDYEREREGERELGIRGRVTIVSELPESEIFTQGHGKVREFSYWSV